MQSSVSSFWSEFISIKLCPKLDSRVKDIYLSGSIFMTVAIALERFFAVHYPINYSQAMMQANALNKRVSKYVITVTALSVLFSVNKFFEAR